MNARIDAPATARALEPILLDARMPDMDGYPVCRQLKADAHLHVLPAIFLSASRGTEDEIKSFNVGGAD